MSKVFFTSDLHIGHENILKFEPSRDFNNIHDMHNAIVERWNKTCGPRDHIWVLGDVLFGRYCRDHHEVLGELNGIKHLVLGNHDTFEMEMYERYFNKIVPMHTYKGRLLLTHIPVHPSQHGRFKLNIHGHLHSKVIDDPFYFNVCLEQNDLTPISLDVIRERVREIEESLSQSS